MGLYRDMSGVAVVEKEWVKLATGESQMREAGY
jgi:hypothetical protein